jgi:peptidoglycan/LPS O-acetylase OafA/YrhL
MEGIALPWLAGGLEGPTARIASSPKYVLPAAARSRTRDASSLAPRFRLGSASMKWNDILGPTAHAYDGKSGYIPTLDGWRTIAVFFVLAAHSAHSADIYFPNIGILSHTGLIGVRIFFALSGFLITSRILEEIDARQRLSLSGFYLRRGFRILPPLLLLLTVVGLLGVLGVVHIGILEWFAGLFFFANWVEKSWYLGHLWSLAVEEHFYLLWPGLFALAGSRRTFWIAVAAVPVLAVWRLVAWRLELYSSPAIFWGRTDIQLDGLLWGAIWAYIDRYHRGHLKKLVAQPWVATATVALIVGIESLTLNNYNLSMLRYSIVAALIPIAIVGTARNHQFFLFRPLEWRPMRYVGRLSYSIYLWQQILLTSDEARVTAFGALHQFPLNLFMVFPCAVASYYLIERPMIKIGHRIATPVTSGRVDESQAQSKDSP